MRPLDAPAAGGRLLVMTVEAQGGTDLAEDFGGRIVCRCLPGPLTTSPLPARVAAPALLPTAH